MRVWKGIAAAAAGVVLATAASAETVSIRADNWCPYNCEPGSEQPGYMIEVLQQALEPHGYSIDYQNMNWVRSLAQAEAGEITGVVGASEEEVPGFRLSPILGVWDLAIAVRKGEAIDMSTAAPFEGRTVGAIRGYEYGGAITEYIEAHEGDTSVVQLVGGDAPLESNLKKLAAGRVDMVPDDAAVLRYTIANLGLSDEFVLISVDEPSPLYAAFSPNVDMSGDLAAHVEAAVADMRADGRLASIMERYGLSDWQ
ncbi:substrate-binding periplasmic protein [Tritonibacter horizontis]|uniref:L-cystine-binding protein TcyA n=1 Tax=Tritonibacter horizontis TaxID=1768241 RepID=A0A132C1Z1_9RHOB|nr:transporter substrate-binding domain-containing protein [Tritonibacter horizontis]KUP94282.1 L-cystine-binding protein TcyA precursor [Tritonibacter horizontis]